MDIYCCIVQQENTAQSTLQMVSKSKNTSSSSQELSNDPELVTVEIKQNETKKNETKQDEIIFHDPYDTFMMKQFIDKIQQNDNKYAIFYAGFLHGRIHQLQNVQKKCNKSTQ